MVKYDKFMKKVRIKRKALLKGREYLILKGVQGKTKIHHLEHKYKGRYDRIAKSDCIIRKAKPRKKHSSKRRK